MGLPATSMAAFNPDMCTELLRKGETSNKPTSYTVEELPLTSGKLYVTYDMQTILDKIEIKLDGQIFTTDCVDGKKEKQATGYSVSSNSTLTVEVTPNCDSSLEGLVSPSSWSVSLVSCPEKTVSTSEYDELVKLYTETGGTSWNNQDGWKDYENNKDVCHWSGIVCDDEGNVIELNLPNNNMIKELPSSIGNLSRLVTLNLSNNDKLGGALPSSMGSLENLKNLDISYDNFSSLPAEVKGMANLVEFNVSNNKITTLPTDFVDLITKNSTINLSQNNICYSTLDAKVLEALNELYNRGYDWGKESQTCNTIIESEYDALMVLYRNWSNNPYGWGQGKEICSWTGVTCGGGSVVELKLSNSGLSGTLPGEISQLSNLVLLDLSGNDKLSGSVPNSITNLTKLLSNGVLPLQIAGTKLCVDTPKLSSFVEEKSGIKLPDCEEQAAQAVLVAAQYEVLMKFFNATGGNTNTWTRKNGWGGQNKDFCTWENVICQNGLVTSLNLYSNGLTGSIPSDIGKLTSLTSLELSKNQLEGEIPSDIGNLTNLTTLSLSDNQLTGSIPSDIGKLTNLTYLSLFNNKLEGNIPGDIGNLTNLTRLWLSDNKLTGSIPSDIGNLTNLTSLELGNNKLEGKIPSISNLTKLTSLSLYLNQLEGEIPSDIGNLTNLTRLSLFNNKLEGNIPSIGNLTNLTELSLGHNQLKGSIPSIGNLTNLTELWLSDNQLTGSIPSDIGNLTKLTRLSLGNNQLTGNIPTSIGNLTNLTELWLNDNQLTGTIPDGIVNVGAISGLGLTNNHLCTTNSNVADFLTSKDSNWKQQTNTPCDPRYSLNTSEVNFGFDHKKTETPLTLSGNLVNNSVIFTVKKTDGSAFSQNGTMYLKVGSFETYGAERARKTVSKGDFEVTFDAVDNDKFPNYPKMYFARFESSENEYHAYAGPIIISKRLSDGAVASTFNGNIVSYQNGDQLVFEYIDPENDYNEGYAWYVNDDLSEVQSTSKTLSVPSPLLFSTNPIHYVALKSGADEWLYSYPQQKDTYEIASFRNYIFKTSQGKTDKAVVVSFGNQWLWVNTEQSVANNFEASLPKEITTIHKDSLTLPPVDISAFSNERITVYEGIKNNSYQTADFPDLGLDAKSRKLVNIDPLTDFLNRKLKSTSSSLRANFPMDDLEKALIELDKSPLLPSDFTPSNIKSETVSLVLNMMALHIGMDNTMKFLLKLEETTDNTLDIINAIISLRELAVKMEQADQDGLSESIKGLYVLSYIFDKTPLNKFLDSHKLIDPITQQIEQVDKVLNEKSCAFQVGKVRLSIYEDVSWWPFDRDLTENIEEVQLFPLRLIYGDGVTTKLQVVTLDERKKHPVTLTKNAGVWEYPEHSVTDELDFSITYPTYCGAWMVAAKAGDKMYYGRVTLRSDGNVPSAVVVVPGN
ncbi:leucine-rich repeat domain-containing protein [Beggiatoa leptomitoformis]|nr:leucine-rich repeat domain-containing protein [Beggiatoa leptomitoformis]